MISWAALIPSPMKLYKHIFIEGQDHILPFFSALGDAPAVSRAILPIRPVYGTAYSS
jgi:hypothetical protein